MNPWNLNQIILAEGVPRRIQRTHPRFESPGLRPTEAILKASPADAFAAPLPERRLSFTASRNYVAMHSAAAETGARRRADECCYLVDTAGAMDSVTDGSRRGRSQKAQGPDRWAGRFWAQGGPRLEKRRWRALREGRGHDPGLSAAPPRSRSRTLRRSRHGGNGPGLRWSAPPQSRKKAVHSIAMAPKEAHS